MSFEVAAAAYDAFMGRHSRQLSARMSDLAGVRAGMRALDVGSGPGALTGELVRRLGADRVAVLDYGKKIAEGVPAEVEEKRRKVFVKKKSFLVVV